MDINHVGAVSASPELRTLWPEIEPYNMEFLQVSNIHNLYIEECGNPDGTPVLVLHGGPGAGSYPQLRRFFNPSKYRIILFDQRGSGKSTPLASLDDNTTWDLVGDIEKIRKHLGVERWVVFGGSWGSTLALVYAECHPERVRALIVRGIYLGEQEEIDWFYQSGGIAQFFPERWENYMNHIPAFERSNLLEAYWRRLTSSDANVVLPAARAWSVFEGSTATLRPDPELEAEFDDPVRALPLARIECWYFKNASFLKKRSVIDFARFLKGIPGVIVHGRYDMVCQPLAAWRLHRAWPDAELHFTISGHAAGDPENTHRLVCAAEKFADAT